MYACIYCDPDFSCGRVDIQPEVVQEVLADLKILLTALRARGDLLPEKISGGKVGEAVLGHNLVALGALATKKE